MKNLTPGRDRRRLWNFFKVEEGFKQRQFMQLQTLAALNVAASTAAFLILQPFESLAQLSGVAESSGLDTLKAAIGWAAIMGGLGGLIALVMGVVTTHRVAGPIYKFKQELGRIAAGAEPRRIELRKGDELGDLAEAINEAIAALAQRSVARASDLSFDQEQLRATHMQILEGLESVDSSALPEKDRHKFESWHAQMRALREKIDSEQPWS